METAVERLHRFYVDALFFPAVLSCVLVVVLLALRHRRVGISLVWARVTFAVGFFWITCMPHAWKLLFSEPCVLRFTTPSEMCFIGPASYLQAGVFAGVIGALMGWLAFKLVLALRRRFAG